MRDFIIISMIYLKDLNNQQKFIKIIVQLYRSEIRIRKVDKKLLPIHLRFSCSNNYINLDREEQSRALRTGPLSWDSSERYWIWNGCGAVVGCSMNHSLLCLYKMYYSVLLRMHSRVLLFL